MDINYTSGRKLNRELINRLATCEYISEHRNLFITGATGCGKTYMACAFGMEACMQYYSTKYVRMLMQSLIVLLMIVIALTSLASILLMTNQCAKYMVWIKHYENNL